MHGLTPGAAESRAELRVTEQHGHRVAPTLLLGWITKQHSVDHGSDKVHDPTEYRGHHGTALGPMA